ncbi:MAG: PAS domain S-box protein [Campylobacterota bacterium]|nr:PAS domain S-box protein [Campylobacterota bacterium]
MKKIFYFAAAFLIILGFLAYNKQDTKEKVENYFYLSEKLNNIASINNRFDLFLSDILKYHNYDIIQKDIDDLNIQLDIILSNKSIQETDIYNKTIELNESFGTKIKLLDKFKSYNAILNNSYRYMNKLQENIISKELFDIYVTILTLNENPNIDYKKYLEIIKNIKPQNKEEKSFIAHSTIIFNYFKSYDIIVKQNNNLRIFEEIKVLVLSYDKFSNENINKEHMLVVLLFILLVLSVLLIVYEIYSKYIKQKELARFKQTIENSDNIIVVTDAEEKIKYVNKAFVDSYGYTFDEVIGKKPSLIKSNEHTKEFYDDLKKTIYSGKKWTGTFINISKTGDRQYEKSSITPVFDDDGKIIEFVAIKLNISREVEVEKALKENEKILMQQSKMASMGEMISNIAHQWRQPLSIISTSSSGVKVEKEYGILTDESLIRYMDEIGNATEYLTKTIDDFRDFFKPNKEKSEFKSEAIINKSIKLVNAQYKSNYIDIQIDCQDIDMYGLDGELIQVLVNIFNNAKDVLKENEELKEKIVLAKSYLVDDKVAFTIHDNGGGVPSDIIDKIFEPYFTTKHKSQGTGIGLYMSHEIVTNHMKGILTVRNEPLVYKDKEYLGAKFTIVVPKKLS